jgi:hypothetical protein
MATHCASSAPTTEAVVYLRCKKMISRDFMWPVAQVKEDGLVIALAQSITFIRGFDKCQANWIRRVVCSSDVEFDKCLPSITEREFSTIPS